MHRVFSNATAAIVVTAAFMASGSPSWGSTKMAQSTLVPGDTKLYASPWNWRKGDGFLEANVPGAYLKVRFGGPALTINLDPATYATYPADQTPMLKVFIDGAPRTIQLGTGQKSWTIDSLGDGSHDAVIYLMSIYVFADSWRGNAVRVNSVQAASFGAPTIRSHTLLALGDSITKGESNLAVGQVTHAVPETDGSASYSQYLARALDAEVGVVAYGGQGWENRSAGNFPPFPQGWSFYSEGHSRLVAGKLSPIPDYVTNNHGANAGAKAATVEAWIKDLRAALNPDTPIFEMMPFNVGRGNNPAILAGIAASKDAHISPLDLGEEGAQILRNNSADATHPNVTADGILGSLFAGAVWKALRKLGA